MTQYFILIALVVAVRTTAAQNIVPNGSFEQNTGMPMNTAQWYLVSDWTNITGDPDCQSPDYFHANAGPLSAVQLPDNVYATIAPQDGDAVMGIGLYMVGSPEYREYIAAQLTEPMVVGATYLVRFYAALGSDPFHGGASNNLGVVFTVGPLSQRCVAGVSSVIPANPQGETTAVLTNTEWEMQSYSFIADFPYDYIAIGNFRDDANTVMQPLDSATYSPGAYYGFYGGYYFIDNVSVVKTGDPKPTAIQSVHQPVVQLLQNPVSNVVLLRNASNRPLHASMIDATGRIVAGGVLPPGHSSTALPASAVANGLYRLQITDEALVVAGFNVVVLH